MNVTKAAIAMTVLFMLANISVQTGTAQYNILKILFTILCIASILWALHFFKKEMHKVKNTRIIKYVRTVTINKSGTIKLERGSLQTTF